MRTHSLGNKETIGHWCDTVCARDENMMSSTLNTPATSTPLSSETLTVMTLPADSTTSAESVSDNDSDGEEEDDVSDNDLEILGEQSGTEDTTNKTDDASGGTETTAKKAKIMMTEQEQTFVKELDPQGLLSPKSIKGGK